MDATPEHFVEAFFKFVDTNRDGRISYSELIEALSFDFDRDFIFSEGEEDLVRGRDLLHKYFAAVDVDRDQMLSKAEVLQWFASQKASLPPAQAELIR
jgi:Ca2+-binding EF-hand superfamily protein